MRWSGDERGIVIDFFVRVLLGLAVAGIILFDAGSLIINVVGLDSKANDIAIEVVSSLEASRRVTPRDVEAKAVEIAEREGVRLVSAELDTQRRTLTIALRRTARTIVVSRIGAIKKWGRASADATVSVNI